MIPGVRIYGRGVLARVCHGFCVLQQTLVLNFRTKNNRTQRFLIVSKGSEHGILPAVACFADASP